MWTIRLYLPVVTVSAACAIMLWLGGCDDTSGEKGVENADTEGTGYGNGSDRDGPGNVDGEPTCDGGGQTCSAGSPCAAGNICSNRLFPEEEGFYGTKCYPECQQDPPVSGCCQAGSVCLVFDDQSQSQACLETGTAERQNLSIKLLPAGKSPNHKDVAFTGLRTQVGGQKIPLNMSYALESLSDFDGDGTVEETRGNATGVGR